MPCLRQGRGMKTSHASLGLLLAALVCSPICSSAADLTLSAEPSTYLFDAPQAAPTASGQALSNQAKWARLDEDDTTHRFRGSPTLMNDKVVAVLENAQLALYSRQTEGYKLCARLQPVCEGRA